MRLYSVLTVVLLTLFCVHYSQAEITPGNVNASSAASDTPFNEFSIQNDVGDRNDYTLLLCGTTSDGSNTFNDLIISDPGGTIVTELDNNQCNGGTECVMGVWGIYSANASYENTCSWSDPTTVFGGGFFRFSGVDFNNPVIDIQCESGSGQTLTAPSIETEDNSRVIRLFVYNVEVSNSLNQTEEADTAVFVTVAVSNTENIVTTGISERFDIGGPTGTSTINSTDDTNWRACTLALRMQGPAIVKPIPTLSEWGLMATAGILGLAGFIAIRKKFITA